MFSPQLIWVIWCYLHFILKAFFSLGLWILLLIHSLGLICCSCLLLWSLNSRMSCLNSCPSSYTHAFLISYHFILPYLKCLFYGDESPTIWICSPQLRIHISNCLHEIFTLFLMTSWSPNMKPISLLSYLNKFQPIYHWISAALCS